MFQVGRLDQSRIPDAESGLPVAEDWPAREPGQAIVEEERPAETLEIGWPALGGALKVQAGRRRADADSGHDSSSDFDDDEDEDLDDDDDDDDDDDFDDDDDLLEEDDE